MIFISGGGAAAAGVRRNTEQEPDSSFSFLAIVLETSERPEEKGSESAYGDRPR
jgi:hypothetical protein